MLESVLRLSQSTFLHFYKDKPKPLISYTFWITEVPMDRVHLYCVDVSVILNRSQQQLVLAFWTRKIQNVMKGKPAEGLCVATEPMEYIDTLMTVQG